MNPYRIEGPALISFSGGRTSGYPMTDEIRGMVRNPDHVTSVRAARGVSRETLKSRVMQFARDAGPFGFIDEDLVRIDPDRPESSLRKRRTELSQAGWIVEAGYVRKNKHDQASDVFVHRDHALNPPPLGAQPKPKKHGAAEDERAAIAAWLRKPWVASVLMAMDEGSLEPLALEIERGEHLK